MQPHAPDVLKSDWTKKLRMQRSFAGGTARGWDAGTRGGNGVARDNNEVGFLISRRAAVRARSSAISLRPSHPSPCVWELHGAGAHAEPRDNCFQGQSTAGIR